MRKSKWRKIDKNAVFFLSREALCILAADWILADRKKRHQNKSVCDKVLTPFCCCVGEISAAKLRLKINIFIANRELRGKREPRYWLAGRLINNVIDYRTWHGYKIIIISSRGTPAEPQPTGICARRLPDGYICRKMGFEIKANHQSVSTHLFHIQFRMGIAVLSSCLIGASSSWRHSDYDRFIDSQFRWAQADIPSSLIRFPLRYWVRDKSDA